MARLLYSDSAFRVLSNAEEEAKMMGRDAMGDEHILITLAHEKEGIVADALSTFGITEEAMRVSVLSLRGVGNFKSNGDDHLPFTPGAKKTLALADREAKIFDYKETFAEHVLLGLLESAEAQTIEQSVVLQLLKEFGVRPHLLRLRVSRLLEERGVAVKEPGVYVKRGEGDNVTITIVGVVLLHGLIVTRQPGKEISVRVL